MTEFKFSCPHCGQHIQCNDAWCAHQINCPTCAKALMVPKFPGGAPGLPPSAPAPVPAPATAPGRLSTAPQPPSAPPPPAPPRTQPAGKPDRSTLALVSLILAIVGFSIPAIVCGHMAKARIRRNPLMTGGGMATAGLIIGYVTLAIGLAAVIAVFTIFGAAVHSVKQALNEAESGNNTTLSSSTASQGPATREILQRVSQQLQSFTSYSVSGQCVLNMDMSKVDPTSVPGMEKANKDAQKQFKQQVGKPQNMTTTFEFKMARPDLYRLEWSQEMAIMNRSMTNKGAAWSAGDGYFVLLANKTYAKVQDQQTALTTAVNASGGAAAMALYFFNAPANEGFSKLEAPAKGSDETLDGEDCYVISGAMQGQKTTFWITKESYLIKQQKITIGGKMPDFKNEDVEKAITAMGQKPSPEKIEKMRKMMQSAQKMVTNMKGSMMFSYQTIETNKPFAPADFKYTLPAGAKQVSSLMPAAPF